MANLTAPPAQDDDINAMLARSVPLKSPTLLDYAKTLASGVGGLVSGVGQGVKQVSQLTNSREGQELGKTIRELGNNVSEYWNKSLTPGGQYSLTAPVINDDLSLGETPFTTALMSAVQSVPGMVAMAIPGAKMAKALEGAGTGAAIEAGLGKLGVGANRAKWIGERAPSAIGMGVSEGIFSGLQNAAQTSEQIDKLPMEKLRASPFYQSAYAETDPTLPEQERHRQALESVKDAAEKEILGRTALFTGGISALTGGGVLGQMVRKPSGGVARRILSGAGSEGTQEFVQSGEEQLVQNLAMRNYADPTQNIGEGVLNAAVTGGLAGGILGGAGGGIHAALERNAGANNQQEAGQPVAGQSTPNQPVAWQAAPNQQVTWQFTPNQQAVWQVAPTQPAAAQATPNQPAVMQSTPNQTTPPAQKEQAAPAQPATEQTDLWWPVTKPTLEAPPAEQSASDSSTENVAPETSSAGTLTRAAQAVHGAFTRSSLSASPLAIPNAVPAWHVPRLSMPMYGGQGSHADTTPTAEIDLGRDGQQLAETTKRKAPQLTEEAEQGKPQLAEPQPEDAVQEEQQRGEKLKQEEPQPAQAEQKEEPKLAETATQEKQPAKEEPQLPQTRQEALQSTLAKPTEVEQEQPQSEPQRIEEAKNGNKTGAVEKATQGEPQLKTPAESNAGTAKEPNAAPIEKEANHVTQAIEAKQTETQESQKRQVLAGREATDDTSLPPTSEATAAPPVAKDDSAKGEHSNSLVESAAQEYNNSSSEQVEATKRSSESESSNSQVEEAKAGQHSSEQTEEGKRSGERVEKEVKGVEGSSRQANHTGQVEKEIENAGAVRQQEVSERDSGQDSSDVAARNRNSESVDVGVAEYGQGADRDRLLSGRADSAGEERARSAEPARERSSGTPRDSAGVRSESGAAGTATDAGGHVIDADEIGKGGLLKKYRDNVAAIKVLKALEAEGRVATPEERKVLAKYVGWGAMKGPFDQNNKAWAKQHAELKELLTEEEFRAARASTLNAHYTSPEVVLAMYDALKRLGFKHGRILEPSVGIGNFFGLMSREMRSASQLYGVELDSLTSRLVAALYPEAKIAKETGFQDFNIPSEYFDLVIGNPPFGSYPLVDSERSPYSGFSIHNYFLAKSIDKLRPGGLMAVVVSHHFLDAQDGRARKWIGERADLIGGVRLPRTAFKQNAGTDVVTDILIFQKRKEGEQPKSIAPWQDVVDQVNINPKTGEPVTHKVNQFFVANPQYVLGKPSAGGSMYAANEYTVEPESDLKEALADWVKTLPEGVFDNDINRYSDEELVDIAVPDGIKEGSYFIDANGNVMQRGKDVMGVRTATPWIPRNETQLKRMKGMIAIRDALRKQMRLEQSRDATEQEVEANRAELNKLYDEFVKKYGYLNNTTNRSIFLDDPEANLIQGLEFDYDKGISKTVAEKEGIEPREPSARKADIFYRRVFFPPQEYIKVETAKDALLASLNNRGRIDLDYIAKIYDKPIDKTIEELGDLVFDDPQKGIVTADEYLSGDVKTKLEEAKAAALDNPKYRRNVEALEKVIPKDKTPSEIFVGIGASFVPPDIYEAFVEHISGGKAKVHYVNATGQWIVAFDKATDPSLNIGKFGIPEMPAQGLFELTMLGKGAVVKETIRNRDGTSTTIVLEKETEAAREKQNAIKAEWQKWLWQDPERAERIAAIYNEKMNRFVERKYDGSHMTFPGMNPRYQLLEHQKNGVWRGLQTRQILLDHVVGAGKTFQMVAMAMEMRRLGIARKPLFVVPNHLIAQWRSEFIRLYPGAKILAATPEDFSADNRERLFARIITGDWDAVIIGHSSLKKIGLPKDTEKAILKEQIDEIADAIEQMKKSRGDSRIVADMERIRRNLEAKMASKLAAIGERTKMATFDELGIDALFVDELHEFKNLNYITTMDRVPGMGNPNGSAKAFDLFVKIRWLYDTFGDKAPIVAATGTPVSNSLVEMFNIQRYMQYPILKRLGLHVFDAWARQFGSIENVYEVAPSGAGYRQSVRFAKFANLPALMTLYHSFADTITLDDLKTQEEAHGKRFPVPKVAGGRPIVVVAKRSPEVAAFMGIPRAETDDKGNIVFSINLDAGVSVTKDESTGKWITKVGDETLGYFDTEQEAKLKVVERTITPSIWIDPKSIIGRFANLRQLTRETKGRVNALSLTSEANKAGLDYRLIDPNAPDFPVSKVNLAVENIVRLYKQWDADKGTQLVFCDMSIPLSARANYSNKQRRLYVRNENGGIEMKRGTMHTVQGHEYLPFFIVQRGSKDTKRFDVYDAASGLLLMSDFRSREDAIDAANEVINDDRKRQIWIDKRNAAGEIKQSEIDDYNNEHDIDTEDPSLFFTLDDIAGISGAVGFSVYDDLKAKLVARGIPEREIAFIHDYDTPTAKGKLFRAMNNGSIRILIGSTPKMGAGTNVQERLVALHHLDAPWRPSDLEQREGRIIRRGNKLYERDPDNFEVFIFRYATEQTYDARRWQLLEHKARSVEQLRKFDGTTNEISDIEGEAANAAEMKAAASGDPLILEETRLRNEVKRLEQLQAAHADEVLTMARKAREAQEYADKTGPEIINHIENSLRIVRQHPLDEEGYAPIVLQNGKELTNKEEAYKTLTSIFENVRTHFIDSATIKYRGLTFTLRHVSGNVVMDTPTGIGGTWRGNEAFSPSGFVQRLKNYIDRMPAMIEDVRARIEKSRKDAESMRELSKQPFPYEKELEETRKSYLQVQRLLMAKGPEVPEEQKQLLAEAIERQKEKLRQLGFGDAVDELFNTAKYSKRASTDGGMTIEEVQKEIAPIMAKWKYGDIRVVQSVSDLPYYIEREIRAVDAGGEETEGVYGGDGIVYLIADNLSDANRAREVLAHEAIGHLAAEELVNREDYQRAINSVLMLHRIGNKTIRTLGQIVDERQPGLPEDIRAKEILALAVETGEYKAMPVLQKFVAAIVSWVKAKLRALGFKTTWANSMSEGEIFAMLRKGEKALETGKSATADQKEKAKTLFSRSVIIGSSGRQYTPEQIAAMKRTGSIVEKKTIDEIVKSLWQDAGKKIAQGIFDQFRPVRDISEHAYTLLRLSKGSAGAFEAFLHYGKLSIRDGAYDADTSGGVLEKVFYPLGKETTDFLRWVAGNRAERLMQEGRENLFTPADIAAFKSLASGTTDFDYVLPNGSVTRDRALIYRDSLRKFNEFNKNVLDIAEQSGLIDPASRHLWEHEFYVPFYRVADEEDGGVRGMNIKDGAVRQEAFKRLKGGKEKLNDLLANTLMNWAHLIDASAKNRAAVATLQAAAQLGIATPTSLGAKGAVWVMNNGHRVWYKVDDPYLLEAINGLEYHGLKGPIMDVMSAAKRWLTIGVTASPFFKIRNLIRDSIQALAIADVGYNPISNVVKGYKLTNRATQEYVSALAGGGLIRFGTMLEGDNASRVRRLIKIGARDEHILDNESKLQTFYDKYISPVIDAYQELGNRGEEINRMVLYDALIRKGVDHATASLMARDLMDFSMHGTWRSIRFLTQVVPFMNARLQGIYKLGRAVKEDSARFAIVLAGVVLVSLALLAAYNNDDDWKKREDWDRDNYWWFKLGGTAFRIPKPFEIGAIGTLAERTAELAFDDEMTFKRFSKLVLEIASNQLSMNPVPQFVKPIIEIYANKDSFTGRPIETMDMERMAPAYRYNQNTSMLARSISTAGNALTGDNFLSPVQIDHLIRSYFGWLGAAAVGTADIALRAATDQPTRPALDYWKTITGGMVSELDGARSRYVTVMYEQMKEVEQAYMTWRELIRQGKAEEANEYRAENAEKLARYKRMEAARRKQTMINNRIKFIENSSTLDPEEKKRLINMLRQNQDKLARSVLR